MSTFSQAGQPQGGGMYGGASGGGNGFYQNMQPPNGMSMSPQMAQMGLAAAGNMMPQMGQPQNPQAMAQAYGPNAMQPQMGQPGQMPPNMAQLAQLMQNMPPPQQPMGGVGQAMDPAHAYYHQMRMQNPNMPAWRTLTGQQQSMYGGPQNPQGMAQAYGPNTMQPQMGQPGQMPPNFMQLMKLLQGTID